MTIMITQKNKRLLTQIFVCLLVALFFCSILPVSPAAAETTKPVVRAAEKYDAQKDTFVEVPVYVDNAPGIAGFQFDLHFNPEIAKIKPREGSNTAVQLGAMLSGSAPIVNYNNAEQGVIRVAWMELQEVKGSGEICRITFKVVSEGITALELEKVELVRLDGRFEVDAENGFITSAKQQDVRASGVSINENDQNIVAGSTVQLSATVEPQNAFNKDVTWSSNNEKVASVNDDGLVTAHAEGEAVITVTSLDGGFKDTIKIKVRPAGILIDAPERLPHAYTGHEYEYKLIARGENDTFNWSISSGELPPGLELDTAGIISGTPTETGRFDFTLMVTDDEEENEKTQDFILWVADKDSSSYEGGVIYTGPGAFKSLIISHSSMEVNLQWDQLPYTMVVIDRNADHINLQVDLYNSDDKLKINGSSKAPSSLQSFPLDPGNNTFTINIYPAAGSVRQHNITVFKIH